MIDLVLGELPFCFVYVDDILIFSKDLSSHVDNLWEVFYLCRKHGLTIGLPKCEFDGSKIEFLGHLLSASGCSSLMKYSAAISTFPPPSDKPALQRFLGTSTGIFSGEQLVSWLLLQMLSEVLKSL